MDPFDYDSGSPSSNVSSPISISEYGEDDQASVKQVMDYTSDCTNFTIDKRHCLLRCDCPDCGKMVFLFGLANLHHCQKEGDTSASVSSLKAAKSPVDATKPDGEGAEGLTDHQIHIAVDGIDRGPIHSLSSEYYCVSRLEECVCLHRKGFIIIHPLPLWYSSTPIFPHPCPRSSRQPASQTLSSLSPRSPSRPLPSQPIGQGTSPLSFGGLWVTWALPLRPGRMTSARPGFFFLFLFEGDNCRIRVGLQDGIRIHFASNRDVGKRVVRFGC